MKKVETGRLASDKERAYARAIVEMYEKAAKSPDGMLCLDPENPPPNDYFDSRNPSEALIALAQFAEHGTFAPVEEGRFEHFLLKRDFKAMREAGQTYEDAVFDLAVKHQVDTRTVERWLAKPIPLLMFQKKLLGSNDV